MPLSEPTSSSKSESGAAHELRDCRGLFDLKEGESLLYAIETLKGQTKAPTWRSYATPPDKQDGVKLTSYEEPMVLCLDEEQCIRLRSWTFVSYATAWKWTHITLPKLPPEPEQDADEAVNVWNMNQAWRKHVKKCECHTPFEEFEAGYRSALDFVRNQATGKTL